MGSTVGTPEQPQPSAPPPQQEKREQEEDGLPKGHFGVRFSDTFDETLKRKKQNQARRESGESQSEVEEMLKPVQPLIPPWIGSEQNPPQTEQSSASTESEAQDISVYIQTQVAQRIEQHENLLQLEKQREEEIFQLIEKLTIRDKREPKEPACGTERNALAECYRKEGSALQCRELVELFSKCSQRIYQKK